VREMASLPNVALIGSGEYTTGYTGQENYSDKTRGVAGLVFLDLKERGKVQHISIVGTCGTKMPAIRQHMHKALNEYYGLDTSVIKTYPPDDVQRDNKAYIHARDALKPGDMVCIFTPDDTHFEITMAAIERGLHVILTKPPVKSLEEHAQIVEVARKRRISHVVVY
jgi:D-galacturonate reductase